MTPVARDMGCRGQGVSLSSCVQSLAPSLKLSHCPLSILRPHETLDILRLPKSQRNQDHFLRSPCPLLVESSFAGMGGHITGFLASSEPIAVAQRRRGKQATEACRVHLHQPPPTPWGSHVGPLKPVFRDRPHPPLPPDSGQELPDTYIPCLCLARSWCIFMVYTLQVGTSLPPTCRVTCVPL